MSLHSERPGTSCERVDRDWDWDAPVARWHHRGALSRNLNEKDQPPLLREPGWLQGILDDVASLGAIVTWRAQACCGSRDETSGIGIAHNNSPRWPFTRFQPLDTTTAGLLVHTGQSPRLGQNKSVPFATWQTGDGHPTPVVAPIRGTWQRPVSSRSSSASTCL